MRRNFLFAIVAVASGLLASPARGEERFQDFLDGLRERGYFDTAEQYLDSLEQRSDTPAPIKAVIPYEKAVTLMESVHQIRDVDLQQKTLDQAEALLERFAKANPGHELSARANMQRGKLLLDKARVQIWASQSPSNSGKKKELQASGLALVKRAREILTEANNINKKHYDSFEKFIAADQKQLRQERRDAEVRYIITQLELAKTTYEESQCYDPQSPEYNSLLTTASNQFVEIHQKYRSQLAGLFARMYQGKCFEEQGEIGKALGIYNELLSHPGKSRSMLNLQHQVRLFRLICLNRRKDYQLVVQESTDWIAKNRAVQYTTVGLGIRWQGVVAGQRLGEQRDLPRADGERFMRKALEDARTVGRSTGQYRDAALFAIQELQIALGRDPGDPKDFSSALGLARNMVKQIDPRRQEVAKAEVAKKPAAEIAKLKTELDNHVVETGRILKLALILAEPKEDPGSVNSARYLLAWIYLQMNRSYDAAVLGEYVAVHAGKDESQQAQDAAEVAMSAWVQAHNRATRDKDFEMRAIERICLMMAKQWPSSERAIEARMRLGQIYSEKNRHSEAAQQFAMIPESSPLFADAQIAAGQAAWLAYVENIGPDGESKVPAADQSKLQSQAEAYLRKGLQVRQKQLPEKSDSPAELVAGKVTLCQVLVNKGEFKEVLTLITVGPHSVETAIKVEDESKRPEIGIKSSGFASIVYQLLLRAYVAEQQTDKALQTMDRLEKTISAEGADNITYIYEQLGRELEKEIVRLRGAGNEERLKQVLVSFERFLGELFKRKDTMKFNSLVWIGETYTSLGKGLDAEAGRTYFEKAAETYQEILNRRESQPDFLDDQKALVVQLRLVNCRRLQGDFEKAEEMVLGLIRKAPEELDVQAEAAQVYQDWGKSGRPDAHKQHLVAIVGKDVDGKEKFVWGWGKIASRWQRRMSAESANPAQKKNFVEKFNQSRYNVSWNRQQYGLAQSSTPLKQKELQAAKQELETMALISGNVTQAWKDKFDGLYKEVQREMNIDESAIVGLPWPAEVVPPTEGLVGGPKPVKEEAKTEPVKAEAAAPATSDSGNSFVIMMIATVVVGAGIVGWIIVGSKKKRKRPAYGRPIGNIQLPAGGSKRPTAATAAGAPASRAAGAGASRPSGAAGSGGSAKPANPGGVAAPRQRPADPGAGGQKPRPNSPRPSSER